MEVPIVGGVQIAPGLVIEPQASKYSLVYGAPERIGDLAFIRVPRKSFRRPWVEYRVVLLADKSGRLWLVAAP